MVSHEAFGHLPTGERVTQFTLANAHGLTIRAITYGGIVTQLHVPGRDGKIADIVLGFDNLDQYLAGHAFFGCITGRVAGRVTGGKFSLDGVDYALPCNDPPNQLHSGNNSLDKRNWHGEAVGDNAVRFTHTSPDGDEGYPGNVTMAVTYTLTDANEWRIEYEATTDKPTPLNLTNHAYFNLAGEGSGPVDDHLLQIFADEYVPTDAHMTLLGRSQAVAGANDFTMPKRVGDAVDGLWKQHGDTYFIRRKPGELAVAARVMDPHSGRLMTISTTDPIVQFYTGASLNNSLIGKSGRPYGPFGAFCLECENYPDGVNVPHLGNIILRPGQTYRQTTVHAFSIA